MAPKDYEKVDTDASLDDAEDGLHVQTSRDDRRHDIDVSTSREETDGLLAVEQLRQRQDSNESEKRPARHTRGPSKKQNRSRESGLLYAMEEGPRSSSEESNGHSSEADMAQLGATQAKQRVSTACSGQTVVHGKSADSWCCRNPRDHGMAGLRRSMSLSSSHSVRCCTVPGEHLMGSKQNPRTRR